MLTLLFRADRTHLTTLILCLQVPIAFAVPFPHIAGLVRRLRPSPEFRSLYGVIYTTVVPRSCSGEQSPTTAPLVYEIPDGQVQATGFDAPKDSPSTVTAVTATNTGAVSPTISTTASPPPVRGASVLSTTQHIASTATLANGASPQGALTDSQSPGTVRATSLTSLTTSAIQSIMAPPPSDTTGIVQTTLERSGEPSSQPFPTIPVTSTGSLSLVDTSTLGSIGPTATASVTSLHVENIFQSIAKNAPPPQISSRSHHPVPRLGIQPQQQKLETNKFYANFFLGDQMSGVWTHPYSLSWGKGAGETKSYGMAVSHIERDQLAAGPKTSADAGQWAYFINPVGIQSLVLSAVELGNGTSLTTDHLEAFSVNANLIAPGNTTPTITFPLVQGMAFVTGIFDNGTPLIQSGIGFQRLTYAGSVINSTYKYSVLLDNGFTWLMYVTPRDSAYATNEFTLVNQTAIQGAPGFSGFIQVAKIPADDSDAEAIYDGSAGAYAYSVGIKGSVEGTTGSYSLSRTKRGVAEQSLLIFALPHHIQSFSSGTSTRVTTLQLITTTKGMATAVRGSIWTLIEPELPVDMSFNPWSPTQGSIDSLSPAAIEAVNAAGAVELAENMAQQTNTGSIYFDGKALAKFAAIVYAIHELANNATLALTGLVQLEKAFALHVNNQQIAPLVYDTCWGGAVGLNTYLNGNAGDDFGNTYYNDHHFHYGYHLYTAAVIGYLDPSWLTQGTNKAWVDMLARDFANSIANDPYFPFSRSFDWYMGHSWAKGLFESADGKDEESSSEDTMASYGIKMWGRVIGDKNMEARGNLMLAIQARSLSNYFLYLDDNTVEPAEFIGNKVSGILFENKIDHTTYFGHLIEYIQGIHMLPLMPMSTLIRSPTFVAQEWMAYNFGTNVNSVQGGWRGILMANLAIIDPVSSYRFFSNASGEFAMTMLDGGASQTWYLAWSAALGGSPDTGD